MTTPEDYSLPHETFRRGQLSSIEWCLDGGSPTKVLEAPTGFGKSAIARAISSQQSVIALCRTKGLQKTNYGDSYRFDVLFGRGNYPCVHHNAYPDMMADECVHSDDMQRCEHSQECPYLLTKHAAMFSKRASLNYSYFMLTRWPRLRPPRTLVLDEAHQLSDVILDFVGCRINDRQRRKWDLPYFPAIRSGASGDGMALIDGVVDPLDAAREWLADSVGVLEKTWKVLLEDDSRRKEFRQCENLLRKLRSTISALASSGQDWFILSSRDVAHYRGKKMPGIVIRPLTARHHFAGFFSKSPQTVAMSATIGDFGTFATELGIDDFAGRRVPHQHPPEVRPVHALDAPRMGRKSTHADFEKQADVIAEAIRTCPSDWSGVIHVTKKDEAFRLAGRLARRGLQDRLWVPRRDWSTDSQMREWDAARERVRGCLAVNWTAWEGVDLVDDAICIVAKTPFPFLGDAYERARMKYSGKFYLQRTAWKLEQGLGRTRRGSDDYDLDGQRRGLVCIADTNYRRVRKYLSGSLREAIVESGP